MWNWVDWKELIDYESEFDILLKLEKRGCDYKELRGRASKYNRQRKEKRELLLEELENG